MNSTNIIPFIGREANGSRPPATIRSTACDNVILLANRIGQAMPHRTPTGVFFTTRFAMPSPDIA